MTQRPDSTKYKGDGSTSDFITDTDDYIDKIEQELADSKADRVAISQRLSDAIDELFASNKQLAESQAETQELYRQLATELKAEHAQELAEMRAEIEQLKQGRDFWRNKCEREESEAGKAMINYVCKEQEFERQLAEARADAEHWKAECSSLQRMVHEARADIARKDGMVKGKSMSETPRTDAEFKLEAFFDGTGVVETVLVEFAEQLETELAYKDRQLAEITRQRNAYKKALEMAEDGLMTVRAGIESLKLSAGELNGAFNARPKCEKCKAKVKLIEQMRDALNTLVASAPPSGPLWHGSAEMQIAMAALSAAERGEE